jgi:low affinity Fe/Cu permease
MKVHFDFLAREIADKVGTFEAFFAALAVILVWFAFGPFAHWSDTWQLIINTGTTIATFLIAFLLQYTQNRMEKATQAKLDEIIRAIDDARNQFRGIEKLPDESVARLLDEG